MIDENVIKIGLFALTFILGAVVQWMISKPRIRLQIENERLKVLTDLKLHKQQLTKLKELFLKQHNHNKKLELTLDKASKQNKSLITNLAVMRQQVTNSHEKLNFALTNKEELAKEFSLLASQLFEEKETKYAEKSQQKLNAIIKPFNQQIEAFRQKVDDVYNEEGKQRTALMTEVKNLRELNQQLNQEAINLTQALKGDNKIQGNWGELILERVLENSGLRKGQEYRIQGGFRDTENKLLKPDVIINLPQNKHIIIDSKVSLKAYERYCSGKDKQQNQALAEHITAIKYHVKNLSQKDYSKLNGISSLDFVIMFIPIESALVVAFDNSNDLFFDAYKQKIIIATPTTLLATLKTIDNLWRYEKQNQNTREIAQKARTIYDKFRGFVEDIEKLGKQIDTTQSTYTDALNKLTRGKGNLVNQAQQLVDLGVEVKKQIPQSILNKSDT